MFGFHLEDAEWISRVRRADHPASLGRLGSHELVAEYRRGGQGVVYQATQSQTGRRVALKLLLGGSYASLESQQRFRREIEVAAGLRHPSIVTVYSAEMVDRQPVLSMEWIDGMSTVEWSQGKSGITPSVQDILETFHQICDGVQHAHQRGIIHRDLKPSNVLIDAEGSPHILDFGLAKVIEGDPTTSGQTTASHGFLGTPAYAAPEQLRDLSRADERSDVYSLSVMLYQMLTGRLPYPVQDGIPDLLDRIEKREPPRCSSLRSGIGPELDAILAQGLSSDPQARYQSTSTFAQDLQRYLSGEPVHACPPSPLGTLQKWMRRNPAIAVLAALLVLVLIAFSVVSTIQSWNIRSERDLAVEAREREAAALKDLRIAHNAALAESDRYSALLRFLLQDLIGSENPFENEPDLTVEQVFDRAAERIHELDSQPKARASLHEILGFVYMTLGKYATAEPHLRAAVEFLRAHYPESHRNHARVLGRLGFCLGNLARHDEAELVFEEARRQVLEEIPPDEETLAGLLSEIGAHQISRGALTKAVQSLSEARDLLARKPDQCAALRSTNLFDLGRAWFLKGQLEEAEQAFRQSLEIERGLPESSKADEALILGQLAVIQANRGAAEEAEANYRQALELARKNLGPDHLDLAPILTGLGTLLLENLDHDSALEHFQEALRVEQQNLEAGSPRLAITYGNLGRVLARLGKLAEAEEMHRKGHAIELNTLGVSHPTTLNGQLSLASFLLFYREPRIHEAEQLLRDSLKGLREAHPEGHPDTALAHSLLGSALRRQGKRDEALTHYEATLKLRRKLFPDNHPSLADILYLLGTLQLEAERFEDAEISLDECLEIRREFFPVEHFKIVEATHALADSLICLDDEDSAVELLEQVASDTRENLGRDHVLANRARQKLLQFFRDVGDTDRAQEVLRER